VYAQNYKTHSNADHHSSRFRQRQKQREHADSNMLASRAAVRQAWAHARRCVSTLPPPPTSVEARRVVVTGLGAVSPLGVGAHHAWNALLAGATGLKVR